MRLGGTSLAHAVRQEDAPYVLTYDGALRACADPTAHSGAEQRHTRLRCAVGGRCPQVRGTAGWLLL